MAKKHILIHRFYRSADWKAARHIKIGSAGGLCEMCGVIGEEVHHKIRLTPENVTDVNISINQANLMFLCKGCHNKEHGRFEKGQQFDEDGNIFVSITY